MSRSLSRAPGPRRTALVTGATAGIGAAFARRLAADGYDLVLVARDEQRLTAAARQLADEYGVRADALPADLSTTAGTATVEDRLRADEPQVNLLINNAGLSLHTPFVRSTAEEEVRLLSVNVHAVMRLTLAAVVGMIDRRHGAVINVSSVAGFGAVMPGSTYSASKAWVINFSESVARSLRPYGVRVMVLCPGYTRTEFHDRAGIDASKIPDWLWLDADHVARDALRDLGRGRLISVPSRRYKIAVGLLRHAPRGLIGALVRDARGRIEAEDR